MRQLSPNITPANDFRLLAEIMIPPGLQNVTDRSQAGHSRYDLTGGPSAHSSESKERNETKPSSTTHAPSAISSSRGPGCGQAQSTNRNLISRSEARSLGLYPPTKTKTSLKTPPADGLFGAKTAENTKCNLTSLPPEVQLMVFRNLDRASSACLGLANKSLYPIHRDLRGSVPLCAFAFFPYSKSSCGVRLYDLLKAWMGKDRVYCDALDRFIPKHLRWYLGCITDWFWVERTAEVVARQREEKRRDAWEMGKGLY